MYAKTITLILACCLAGTKVGAQLFDKIKKKVEKRLEEEAEKQTDKAIGDALGEESGKEGGATGSGKANGPFKDLPKMTYDFARGNKTIFFDDFSGEAIGGMASRWTSNGTGSVETMDGKKWLKLFDENTYKIKDLVIIPENFTLEFDILTRAESNSGIRLEFGFDHKKGVGRHYHLADRNPINVDASYHFNGFTFTSREVYPSKKSSIDANMSYFVNDVMKVKLRVDGVRMRAYINEYKVLDTDMADPQTKKYFYLAVSNEKNRAGIYLGNFRIAGIVPEAVPPVAEPAVPDTGAADSAGTVHFKSN